MFNQGGSPVSASRSAHEKNCCKGNDIIPNPATLQDTDTAHLFHRARQRLANRHEADTMRTCANRFQTMNVTESATSTNAVILARTEAGACTRGSDPYHPAKIVQHSAVAKRACNVSCRRMSADSFTPGMLSALRGRGFRRHPRMLMLHQSIKSKLK